MIYFFIFVLSFTSAWALPEGFSQALDSLLETSPQVAIKQAAAEGAVAHGESLSRRYYPQIDLNVGYTQTNSPAGVFMQKLGQNIFSSGDFAINRLNDPDFHGDLSGALSIGGLIWENGALGALERSSRLRAAAAMEEVQQEGWAAMLRFASLHFDWFGMQESSRLVSDFSARLRKDLAESKSLGQSGAVLGADLSMAEAVAQNLDTLQLQISQKSSELQNEFAELTGQDYLPVAAISLKANPAQISPEPSRIQRQSRLRTRAAVEGVSAKQKASAAQLRWIVSQDYHTTGSSDGTATTAGVAFSMKLFDPTRSQQVAAARAQKRAAQAAELAADRATVRYRANLKASLATLQLQVEQTATARQLMGESLQQTQKLYSQGRKSIADVAEIYWNLATLEQSYQELLAAYATTQILWVDSQAPLSKNKFIALFN